MKRHLIIAMASVGVCLLTALAAYRWIAKPSMFKGKSLQAWSMQLSYSPDPKLREQAAAVIQALGTQAVPGLARLLQTQDTVVNQKAWAVAPSLSRTWRRLLQRSFKPPEAAAIRAA